MSFSPATGRQAKKTRRDQRVAGVKAVERAVQNDLVQKVLVAKDAEDRVVRNLLEACRRKGIEVEYAETMKELGEFCGLRVGAAACAVLKSPKGTIE
ncbi:MAG TPA: 50S ribosomal protein L7ae-like protein [Firmicutes bacterium]|nr:50S ribosomal protein L7ae-like protein [Candidatus Fermentithermobacillaceae bacterium]